MDSTEKQFKSKSERIRQEMSFEERNNILLQAILDNQYSTNGHLSKAVEKTTETNTILSAINERQKKDNKISLFVTIGIFAATIYVSAYLEIIDQERLKQLLNAGYTFFTGV